MNPYIWEVVVDQVEGSEIHSMQCIVLAETITDAIEIATGTRGTLRYKEDIGRITLARKVSHITQTPKDKFRIIKVEDPTTAQDCQDT